MMKNTKILVWCPLVASLLLVTSCGVDTVSSRASRSNHNIIWPLVLRFDSFMSLQNNHVLDLTSSFFYLSKDTKASRPVTATETKLILSSSGVAEEQLSVV